eukprot:CAMPEP_0177271082 /NCGR_PEP_ID=MMETSP0367-20130122/65316_1 /TAXON_ID=447022 ORGANISM="Scrippsiella hangoei-like, Strain SHHI-4" /NCGR_SAMPLE_ID=MMETSP0367 /ASSEMBLY_ACC=CAM_ASM_000362 /LENGTH=71 /DNA_ID=CAMNT_0018727071 /DNA_START=223 /DNA_END=436 /DNA_ORIENTATION=-
MRRAPASGSATHTCDATCGATRRRDDIPTLSSTKAQARAEVRLGPWRDQDVAVRGGDVREGQRERRRAANH